ncbi:hypothetical protein AB0D54_03435 [Streptomyces xanthophaeus]|uniref:hypothetical protein n=1 Tax=Streptomyces xanthophaeus TaxID=67385 RepID=UPI00342ADD46
MSSTSQRSAGARGPLGPPPPAVRTAFMLWLTAVAAGAFEASLMLGRLVAAGEATAAGVAPGLAVRLTVFTVAVLVAVRMRRGGGWARIGLAVGLGGFGTASLVVEPLRYLLDGGSAAAALSGADALDLVFGASRVLHLAAVLTAVVLMFRPASNAYFRRGA